MSWYVAVFALVAVALAGVLQVLFRAIRRRRARRVAIVIRDESTDVSTGLRVAQIPTMLVYELEDGEPTNIRFGVRLAGPGELAQNTSELRLASDPTSAAPGLEEAWAAFLSFCCMKAHKEMGLGVWSSLDVTIQPETSEASANDAFCRAARGRSLRWLAHVSVSAADS